MIADCRTSAQKSPQLGKIYKILYGPYRNLQVRLDAVNGEHAEVSYDLLKERRSMTLSLGALELYEGAINFEGSFQNLMTTAFKNGQKGAIIIDGSYALHRSMYGYHTLYTKPLPDYPQGRFVGGCKGFYFELLHHKELFPERDVHVIFDGYDRAKFIANPDYKGTRVKATPQWQASYGNNRAWCEAFTKACGFSLYCLEDREGDDVIGSLAARLISDGYDQIVVFSNDKDFFQLVNDQVTLHIPKDTFRGNSKMIRPAQAAERFEVNRNDKINWARALAGDKSDNIQSVNEFFFKKTGVMTRYQRQHWLPHINAAETLEDVKQRLLSEPRFSDFIEDGAFDTNLRLLEINRTLFDGVDLTPFQNEFNDPAVEELLEEVCFFKELEQSVRIKRILRGCW
jgi:hypothetical protein